MPPLQPKFALIIGDMQVSSDSLGGSPVKIMIERDMEATADALRLQMLVCDHQGLAENVSVLLGSQADKEVVFTGEVEVIRRRIEGVEINAFGKMNQLMNVRTEAIYENQPAGSIANDLISRAGLTAGTIDNGPTLPNFIVDNRCSAYAYLKDLANRLGYELYTNREGQVMFHAHGAAAGLDSMVALPAFGAGGETYCYGKHLLNATARRINKPLKRISVGGESPMSGQGSTTMHWLTSNDTDYQGSAGDGTPARLIIDPSARTKDLADRFAAGLLTTSERKANEIRVRIPGRAQLDLGDTVSTADIADDLLNGTGYIRAIRHRFDAHGGFITELRISQDVNA